MAMKMAMGMKKGPPTKRKASDPNLLAAPPQGTDGHERHGLQNSSIWCSSGDP